MENKNHGEVIIKFEELNAKLKTFGLKIHPWGRIAIVKIEEPYNNWIANNLDSIQEVEQWVDGFLYGISLNQKQ